MKNILVPVDFSDVTDKLVETACQMAQMYKAKVWLLHCVDQSPTIASMSEVPIIWPVSESDLPEHYRSQFNALSEMIASLKGRGVDAEMSLKSGSATDEILSTVVRNNIDLIVIGSHGHGALYNLVVGSVTQSVLHETNTPTLVVPCEAKKVRVKEKAAESELKWDEPMATPY